ncbi:hypothetical protein HPB51_002287 [Rhipicephalus microplus]|uniref:DDE Tnp4 domain-containing protein n=1 Tax=Rhipicephalus microplus TaxID=6941 RepID=A0A9J6DYB9_RHIMP|nr:hypothetical protein HPB51_002287 [Rhipicephalus microplus]
MSDLQSEEELEETSDLAVAAVLVAQIIREDRHRVRLYVESVVDSYSDEEFRRLFRLQRCTTEWSMNAIADKFGVSESTVHVAIRRVLYFLLSISEREIRWPNDEDAARNKRAFRALGRCDGVEAGLPDVIGGYLLGDAAYPLLPWLLPPYRHVTSSWQPWMSKFNHVHSKQRVVVEIAFGLLKGRFRRVDKIDVNSIPQAVETVMAACVLHNLARRHADIFEDSDIANSDLGIFSSEPVDVDHKPT